EADVPPRAAGIGGLVHPVAPPVEVGIQVARAHVDHVWVRGCDLHGADRRYGLDRIENGKPRFSGACRLPDAAVWRADVEHPRLSDGAARRGDTAGAERADVAPFEAGKETRIEGLGSERSCHEH